MDLCCRHRFVSLIAPLCLCLLLYTGLFHRGSICSRPTEETNPFIPFRLDNANNTLNQQTGLPMIYLITPTYPRLTQKADLIRFIYTMRQVPGLHWIVVEDHPNKTSLVQRLLESSGLRFTHLNVNSPINASTVRESDLSKLLNDSSHFDQKPEIDERPHLLLRGIAQRNEGLRWLRANTGPNDKGVVYFADDDNTYNIRLFELMRHTRKVSVWAVGLISDGAWANIQVNNSKVVGWYVNWGRDRYFTTDMAGFAVNLHLFHNHPSAKFYYTFRKGYIETSFLSQFHIERSDLEPVAHHLKEVLVWHTRTEMLPEWRRKPPPGPVLEV